MTIYCQECGAAFEDGHPAGAIHGSHRRFCDACRAEREKERDTRRRCLHRLPTKDFRETDKPAISVHEVAREAALRGMSYGQLVIRQMQAAREGKA